MFYLVLGNAEVLDLTLVLLQGSLQLGKEDEIVACEAVPLTLLDQVYGFLVSERAAIRADAKHQASAVSGEFFSMAAGTKLSSNMNS